MSERINMSAFEIAEAVSNQKVTATSVIEKSLAVAEALICAEEECPVLPVIELWKNDGASNRSAKLVLAVGGFGNIFWKKIEAGIKDLVAGILPC